MVNVAVLGYGTVGSGVAEVIWTNQEVIDKRVGEELRIKYVLDLREFPEDPVSEVLTHDFEDIINDEEVNIVVEVMGGIEPASTFIQTALENGKHVVTANNKRIKSHSSLFGAFFCNGFGCDFQAQSRVGERCRESP